MKNRALLRSNSISGLITLFRLRVNPTLKLTIRHRALHGEAAGSFLSMSTGITKSMKTAISVEDALMERADEAARDLGLSRSGLIAEALRDYLRQRGRARITAQLNRAYAHEPSPDGKRLVRKLRTKLSVPDRW